MNNKDAIRLKTMKEYYPINEHIEVIGIIKFRNSYIDHIKNNLLSMKSDLSKSHIIFLIDTSYSMKEDTGNGRKIEVLKKELKKLIDYGYLDDKYISIVSFDLDAKLHIEHLDVSANKNKILSVISNLQAIGEATYAYKGFSLIEEELINLEGVSNRIIYFTDGEDFDTNLAEEKVKSLLNNGVITTAVGVGSEYNELFLNDIADIGKGDFYHLTDIDKFFDEIKYEIRKMDNEVIRNIEIEKLFYPSNVEPLEVYKVGHGVVKLEIENNEIICGNLTEDERIYFKFRVNNIKREGKYIILTAVLRYKIGKEELKEEIVFPIQVSSDEELISMPADREVLELNKQISIFKKVKEASELANLGKEKEAREKIAGITPFLKEFDSPEIDTIMKDIKNGKFITREVTRALLSYTRTKTKTKSVDTY